MKQQKEPTMEFIEFYNYLEVGVCTCIESTYIRYCYRCIKVVGVIACSEIASLFEFREDFVFDTFNMLNFVSFLVLKLSVFLFGLDISINYRQILLVGIVFYYSVYRKIGSTDSNTLFHSL